jgi:hypothetical protein
VLLGEFKDINKAEAFVREHRLKKLFPNLWLNPISLDVPPPLGPPQAIPDSELEKDSYHLAVTLNCEADKRYGREDFYFRPDEPGAGQEINVALNWSCNPKKGPSNWREKDIERNPTQISFAPVVALGSLSTEDSTTSNPSASEFAYGATLGAFKNFDGPGPWLEVRLLNRRFSGQPAFPSPVFALEHRILVGGRLPFSHRLSVGLSFGYGTRNFLLGSSSTNLVFENVFAPQFGLRARYVLFELSERAFIDLSGAYSTIMAVKKESVESQTGSTLSFTIRARHFFPSDWGVDWFTEYSSTSQATSRSKQSESKLIVGITALRGFD